MKKILLFITTLFSSIGIFGQSSITKDSNKYESHYLIGIHGGTSGIGLNFKYNFINHSSIRFGTSIIPISYSTIQDFGNEFRIDAKATYSNLHFLYELQPFKKANYLKIIAGFGYYTTGMTRATLSSNEAFDAGVTTLTPEEIGELTINIDSKGFAPYLGLGLGKSIPKKRFNLNFDLGTYYLNKPLVTAIGTKLLDNNQEIGTTLTENLKDYRWLPVLQINLNYLIK
jgi:hypothetical protein